MPVNISIPDGKVLSELPPRYRKLSLNIPGTIVQFISSRSGVFINQSVEIAGHIYREVYVEVTSSSPSSSTSSPSSTSSSSSDLSLTLSSPTPVIYLQVLLNGPLRSGYLSMHYLGPDISTPIHISAHHVYHSIYIEPSISLFQQLLSTYSMLTELMTAFATLHKSAIELPYGRYTGTVRVELDKVKNNLLTGNARTKYYDNRIIDFTIAYLDGVHRRTFQDSRLIAIFDTEIISLIHKIESSPELLFNIEDIAKQMGITERALQNGFRLKTNLTVLQYVQQLRMTKAKSLLTTSDLPISDIGMEVGYSDSSFFIRVFKKSTGIAPGRYRSTFSEV